MKENNDNEDNGKNYEKDNDNKEPKKQKVDTNFNEVFKFIHGYAEDLKTGINYFYNFCDFLNIPQEIREASRELVQRRGPYFDFLYDREKFKAYIAAFYVTSILKYQNADFFESAVRAFVNRITKKEEDEIIEVSPRQNLTSFLRSSINIGYNPTNIFDCLTEKEILQFMIYYHKVQLRKLIKELEKQYKKLLYLHLDINVVYGPILYILGHIFDSYEYKSLRLYAACYYVLSNHNRWDKHKVPKKAFIRIGFVKREEFEEAYESIINSIDYEDLVKTYPKYDFAKKKVPKEDNDKKPSVKRIIKNRLKQYKGWRMQFL